MTRASDVRARPRRSLARLAFTLLVLGVAGLVPAFGFWLATSILVYANGPLWLALAAGLLVFPVLPLAWDAYANLQRRRRGIERRPWLGDGARIGLRVLCVSGLVVASLVGFAPALSFTALSTRGDWFLDRRSGPWVEPSRRLLLSAADRLSAWHESARRDPYAALFGERSPAAEERPRDEASPDAATSEAASSTALVSESADAGSSIPETADATTAGENADAGAAVEIAAAPGPELEPPPSPASEPAAAAPTGPPPWPYEARLHPLVKALPEEVETSPSEVAGYFARSIADPFERARAIHDYVADRVAYDAESLADGKYPSYEPAVVFERKKGVCAGYAALFADMARSAGLEAEVIAGFSREAESTLGNGDHAWNAFRVGETWYLVDVTWDAGTVSGRAFERSFRTDYFATPPEIFILSHYPAHPRWQLLAEPVARGAFQRQPSLRPGFFAHGLALVSPARSQFDVADPKASLIVSNAQSVYLIVEATPKGAVRRAARKAAPENECTLSYTRSEAHVDCVLPGPGTYELIIYGARKALGTYTHLGHVEVNYRG